MITRQSDTISLAWDDQQYRRIMMTSSSVPFESLRVCDHIDGHLSLCPEFDFPSAQDLYYEWVEDKVTGKMREVPRLGWHSTSTDIESSQNVECSAAKCIDDDESCEDFIREMDFYNSFIIELEGQYRKEDDIMNVADQTEDIDLKRYRVGRLMGSSLDPIEVGIFEQCAQHGRTSNYIAFQLRLARVSYLYQYHSLVVSDNTYVYR